MIAIHDPAALAEARDALRRLLAAASWEGPPPPLVLSTRAALGRVEAALGEPPTYPPRRERRGVSEESRYGYE